MLAVGVPGQAYKRNSLFFILNITSSDGRAFDLQLVEMNLQQVMSSNSKRRTKGR